MRSLDLFRAFQEYNLGRTKLSTLPQITNIEVTNDCNLNCRFCSREAVYKHRGIGYMSLKKFHVIRYKCSSQFRHPRLFLHGEPTLHPDLAEMVALCGIVGAKSIGITTNGVLLDEELFINLVNSGLNVLGFSFEGTSKADYEHLRRGGNYDTVKRNIEVACKLNAELNLGVKITVNIIDNAITHRGLECFKQHYGNLDGCSGVTVSELGTWAGTKNNDDLEGAESIHYPRIGFCAAPWFTASIQWNGDVVPCCAWLSDRLGNIFEDSLENIWNGEGFQDLRGKLASKGRKGHLFCAGCGNYGFSPNDVYMERPNKLFPFNKQGVKLAIEATRRMR